MELKIVQLVQFLAFVLLINVISCGFLGDIFNPTPPDASGLNISKVASHRDDPKKSHCTNLSKHDCRMKYNDCRWRLDAEPKGCVRFFRNGLKPSPGEKMHRGSVYTRKPTSTTTPLPG